MNLSVIIVSYNTKNVTVSCLRSLDKFPYEAKESRREKFEVIIVDNASTDGSIEEIEKYKPRNYSLKLIKSPVNLGFSKANNAGIKKARGNYILLLNSDTEVLKDSLNILMDFAMDHNDAGIVAPKLLNIDRSIQPSVFRSPTLIRAIRQYWLGEKGLEDKYAPSCAGPVAVEAVVAAAFLITPQGRKKAGLMNEAYFMYFEDLDYCREVKKADLNIYYIPQAQVVHLHGKSGEKVATGKDQWRRLIPGSKIYHGLLIHYLRWAVIKSSQRPEIVILPLLILAGLTLRFLYFPDNIYFAYDQARDAFMVKDILSGNLKLLGPPSSLSDIGLFHGPLYWYMITPFYFLFGGSPLAAAGMIRIFNVFSIILVYLIAKEINDKKTGLIAAALFAFSFENWQQALYFANPAPAVVTTLIFYYGLARIVKGKDKLQDWFLLSLGLGLSIQFQFYLVYLFVPLILCLVFFKRKTLSRIKAKKIIVLVIGLIMTLSTFIISELKFQFRSGKGIVTVLGKRDSATGFMDKFSEWLEKIILTISDSLSINLTAFPYILLSGVFGIGIILTYLRSAKKIKHAIVFLSIWILSTAVLFLVVRSNTYYIVGLSAGIVLLLAVILSSIKLLRPFIGYIVLLFVALNLISISKQAKTGIVTQISVQEGMRYGDEKQIVDYIYTDSKGEEIVVSAFTMPYDIYATWAYIFEDYGKDKYGYVPYWVKATVDGFPGGLPVSDHTICNRYTIYESVRGLERLEKGFREDQDITTLLEYSTVVGKFTVEKRFDRACL